MKAMLLDFPAPIREAPLHLAEMPPPAPGPGQLLLKVSACGLSLLDLQVVEGELPLERLPVIPGHQVVGRVAEAGPGTKRFWGGERVGLGWLFHACGACSFCQAGREHLCRQAEITGLHRDGGLAEFVTAYEDFLFPLPDSLGDDAATPLLGTGPLAYRALHQSGLTPGGRLGLFGYGAPQQLALQIARFWGCEVFVFSRATAQQSLAREKGAAWAGFPDDPPPAQVDSAVIFGPTGALVPAALAALNRGGTLALAGMHLGPIPGLTYEPHFFPEKSVRAVAASPRREVQEFLELAAKIPLVPPVESFPLDQANEALKRLKANQHEASLAIVPIL